MKRRQERSEAEKAADRRRCLNGVCKMTPEESKAREKLLHLKRNESEFHRKLEAEYYRKRRKRPGMRERTNEINRKAYHKDIEKSRAYCREKYRKMMEDTAKHAEYLERRRKRRHGQDGKQTASCKRAQIREKLIPRWERVVFEGRDEAYIRRTTPENARLFRMWRDNFTLFNEMLKRKTERR